MPPFHSKAGGAPARLRACTVELIGRREARALIRRHELLDTVGNASLFFGLRGPDDRLLSIVGFAHGPHSAGADIVLERGWTARRAPANAASYLISRALRYGARHLGWRTVKAFSDPRFGERGLVYQAVGFTRCPPSKHNNAFRYALVDGARVLSDREIRSRFGSQAAARAASATIVRVPARVAWQWQAPGKAQERRQAVAAEIPRLRASWRQQEGNEMARADTGRATGPAL
jgi:hypothetical protein